MFQCLGMVAATTTTTGAVGSGFVGWEIPRELLFGFMLTFQEMT